MGIGGVSSASIRGVLPFIFEIMFPKRAARRTAALRLLPLTERALFLWEEGGVKQRIYELSQNDPILTAFRSNLEELYTVAKIVKGNRG